MAESWSFSTSALIETTATPVIPRTVLDASWTAASAALAKLSGDEPITVMTFAIPSDMLPPSSLLHRLRAP